MKKILPKLLGYYVNIISRILPKTAARHAFAIWCYPFSSALKPHHKQFLDTSEKFSFYHHNIYIQGYKWGNGRKKLLFLHGWQSHSFRWKNYVEALSPEEFTIYAIDAPGHGSSGGRLLNVPLYGEVIKQLVNSLGYIDVAICHSMGSFSTLYALHTEPGLPVGKVVIMACPGKGRDFVNSFKYALKLSDRSLNLLLNYFIEKFEKPIDFFSTPDFAATLAIPGLIIHDEDDHETSYKYAVQIHKSWVNSKLVTTTGLNHNLKSPLVVQEVCDFITDKVFIAELKRN